MPCASTPLLRLMGDEVLAETKQLGASGTRGAGSATSPAGPGPGYSISCVVCG